MDMSPLLALTLTATLSTPATPPPPPAPLLTQAVTLAMAAQPRETTPPGGDSLKNGAIAGAITGGLVMGGFVGLLCHAMNDTADSGACIKATALYAGIGAAGGAAIGAGVDALFARAPGGRAIRLPKAPSAHVRLRF